MYIYTYIQKLYIFEVHIGPENPNYLLKEVRKTKHV